MNHEKARQAAARIAKRAQQPPEPPPGPTAPDTKPPPNAGAHPFASTLPRTRRILRPYATITP